MKKNKIIKNVPFFLFFFIPCILQAQRADFRYFERVLSEVGGLIELIIPTLIAIALLVFIWGLVVFIARSGDEKAQEEGKQKMIWGTIALFVMVSVWGIVALLVTIFDVGTASTLTPPDVLY